MTNVEYVAPIHPPPVIPRPSLLLVLFDVAFELFAVGGVRFFGEVLFVLGGGAVFEADGVVERGEAQVRVGAAQPRGRFEVGDCLRPLLDL